MDMKYALMILGTLLFFNCSNEQTPVDQTSSTNDDGRMTDGHSNVKIASKDSSSIDRPKEDVIDYAEEQLIYQQNASYEKEVWLVSGPMVIFFHPDTVVRKKKIRRWGQEKFYEKANDAITAVQKGVQLASERDLEFVDTYAKNFGFVVGMDTVKWKRPWSKEPWGAYLFNGEVPPVKVELVNIEKEIEKVFPITSNYAKE